MNEAWKYLFYVVVFLAFVCVTYTFYHVGKQDDEDFSPDSDIIKVKYLADIMPLTKTAHGDWIDLRCAEDIVFAAGQYKAIPLGVAIKLPAGYEAIVAPRSSLFKNHGIMMANSIGIIDESYCGNNDEWHFLAYATKATHIAKDERICQFRVVKHMPWMDIDKVVALDAPDRGGIGSSGRM